MIIHIADNQKCLWYVLPIYRWIF